MTIKNPLKGKTDYGWHFEQNVYEEDSLIRSLKAGGGSGNIPKITYMSKHYRIRKLTPTECLRLMAVSDDDIAKMKGAGISDSQLYKMAGNSIVVSVLEAIFLNMNFTENPLTVFEAFAGYGSQSMALRNLGIEHEVVGISEIDKYAIMAYNATHPETKNFGDICQIEWGGQMYLIFNYLHTLFLVRIFQMLAPRQGSTKALGHAVPSCGSVGRRLKQSARNICLWRM